MGHVDGRRLSEVLRSDTLSLGRCVDLVVKLLAVLEEAHRSGVLHRDVKPDNILVTVDPTGREHVKLVSYGLALVDEGSHVHGKTSPGVMCGTPGCMSPERKMAPSPTRGQTSTRPVSCCHTADEDAARPGTRLRKRNSDHLGAQRGRHPVVHSRASRVEPCPGARNKSRESHGKRRRLRDPATSAMTHLKSGASGGSARAHAHARR